MSRMLHSHIINFYDLNFVILSRNIPDNVFQSLGSPSAHQRRTHLVWDGLTPYVSLYGFNLNIGLDRVIIWKEETLRLIPVTGEINAFVLFYKIGLARLVRC